MRIDNETIVTSSGVIRNRSLPRVGVINASSLYDDLFQDCLNDGIDLSWLSFETDTIERLKSEFPDLDDSDISELFEKESQHVEFDSHSFLLGAWVKDSEGDYCIDITGANGNYALVYNTESGSVSVEWSTETVWCNNTSPCYVMADGSGPCGDLDSPGNAVIAYTLPRDMFRDDNE